MKIFLSYGHDRNTPIVLRIKHDLEAAGHLVWIDSAQIKPGDDWRQSIVDGLVNVDWTLGFLSRHSVRDPGVCLDELAIALHMKSGAIATILLEDEAAADPPVSVSYLQWLDMHDWAERLANKDEAGENWYQERLNKLLSLLADPKTYQFSGEIEELDRELRPIPQEGEIGKLVDGFIGREWLRSALGDWCKNAHDLRLFWITGAPGTGKSAFAAWLAHKSWLNVIGVNFCRYNIEERRDPARVLRTLAFQIATRLADFRRLLLVTLRKQKEGELDKKEIAALFDTLLIQPLQFAIDGGRQRERYFIVIDALDETIHNGRSVLTEILAEYCQNLPAWVGVVVTGRPEPSILRQFAEFKPHVIGADSAENLDDLRAYVRRWLAIESLGAGDTNARVEQIVAASQGNFLYLRKLQEAVGSDLMELAHLDDLPQGLIGLYERWFRRQFPDTASYERIRPLLEVLVAASQSVPEEWLCRIFGWSVRDQALMLESLGTMFERRKDGVAPFHKSVRDWLVDGRSAGSDFVIDADAGSNRLIDGLWPTFELWIKQPRVGQIDSFCLLELTYQITRARCSAATRNRFIEHLSNEEFIHGLMWVDTDADEYWRRSKRHWYQDYVARLAAAWPKEFDAIGLWEIVDAFAKVAWRSAATDWDPHVMTTWDDMGRPIDPPPGLKRDLVRYKEWVEGLLLLTTAVEIAREIAKVRPEFVPRLPALLDEKFFDFTTKAWEFAGVILSGTGGRDYIAERNTSFLEGAVRWVFSDFKDDSRIASWIKKRSALY